MTIKNQTAAVIGLARAGIPAARFLLERGARVLAYDSKPREKLSPEALELEQLGATIYAGEHDFQDIETADFIVLSPGLKIHYEPLQSVISHAEARGAQVIGELELAARFCPCPMIAVTGTKGKSTTVKLITEMLRACGVAAHSAGNTGTPLIEMLPQLTPDSWAVVEVSSFQLEKAPTFKPKIAVLLSLLEDHQDYHPTLEQYWETKLKIFDNQSENDSAIFNTDDVRVSHYFSELIGTFAAYCYATTGAGRDDPEKVFAKEGVLGMQFDPKREFIPIINLKDIPLKGKHNVSNVAAALGAVYLALGEEDVEAHDSIIGNTIKHFQALPHRLEIVATKNGVTYVNDSQSTIPDATIAALRSFPAPVTLLVGGRAKIEADAYRNLMKKVRDLGAKIIFFGEAATMLEQIALSCNVEKLQIHRENTLAAALQIAKINALSGETVVLSPACASFDQFTSYEDRGQTFRVLVRDL